MRNIPAIAAAIVVGTLVGSLGAQAQPLQPVTIGMGSASIATAAPRFAAEMGLFKKHGLDVKLPTLENSNIALMAAVAGSVDFIATSSVEIIVAQSRGQDVVGIANIYAVNANILVLAKSVVDKLGIPLSAPPEQRLKALDNLIIASPSATSSNTFILKPSAEDAGAKIRFTYLAQPAMVAAMESGAIQGFIGSSPYYAKPVMSGTGVVWLSGLKGDFPRKYSSQSIALSATRAYADSHKDIVAKVRAALDDFAKAVEERPADVEAAMLKVFPDLDKKTADFLFENEAVAWKSNRFSTDILAHEISVVKAGAGLKDADKLDPAKMFYPY